ncbi:Uncharacterized protein M6B38_228270 [Iris pallida]|uniref:Uncharacterized protein n=1 Tax=Iris pallida TaxID=29817 RepID=A0AAX6DT15_IRIPA|nr:Uncharacterized protein M6B38_228270 [Iris pallida]
MKMMRMQRELDWTRTRISRRRISKRGDQERKRTDCSG